MRFRLEYALAWCVVRAIGILPRPAARFVGVALGYIVYLFHGKLRRVGVDRTRRAASAGELASDHGSRGRSRWR